MLATSAMAVTDGDTYEPVNGFEIQSKWIYALTVNQAEFLAQPFQQGVASYAKARTATLWDTPEGAAKVVVAVSQTMTVGETSDDYATLVIYDLISGKLENTVQMTVDGQPIKGLLCANSVGTDQFGHLWFSGYVATPAAAQEDGSIKKTPIVVYKVDNYLTGECSVAASVELPDDDVSYSARIDYIDLNGDITLTQAGCNIMAAPSSGDIVVYGWHCDQGSTEWSGLMSGGEYVVAPMEDTYPTGQTSWSTGAVLRIVYNEDSEASLYYVDGNTTCPTMYDNEGSVIESFASASDLAPAVGCNGVAEFSLGDHNFVVYVLQQYNATPGCQVRIAELGEGQSFEGMQSMWDVPTQGLGEQSDGGTRVHSIYSRKYTDAAGKEGVYMLSYKCCNGLAVYLVSEQGFDDPNQGGVNDVVADDVNAPVEYFNLQGVAVSAEDLTPGLYITRQGTTVTKQVVK